MNTTDTYLKNQLLIAMPHLADPNFAQALIYLVEHNEHGAMGLVVNRPSGLDLGDILEQLRPDQLPSPSCHETPIYTGGPVQTDRGFVLHDSGWRYQATLDLGELALSTSVDVLFAIADGHGPRRSLVTLGYAGWDAGQLEAEIADNTWLHCPCDARLLFELPAEQRLLAAAATLGVDLNLLSSQAGHA